MHDVVYCGPHYKDAKGKSHYTYAAISTIIGVDSLSFRVH